MIGAVPPWRTDVAIPDVGQRRIESEARARAGELPENTASSAKIVHINAIRAALNKLDLSRQDPWQVWTKAVFLALCRTGREFGFHVGANPGFVSEHERNSDEWLCDVTWLAQYHRLMLAAECEWIDSWRLVEEDFRKLLFVRADVRLMVFDGTYRAEEHLGRMAELVNECTVTCDDDIYLIAALDFRASGSIERDWCFRWFTISTGFVMYELGIDKAADSQEAARTAFYFRTE